VYYGDVERTSEQCATTEVEGNMQSERREFKILVRGGKLNESCRLSMWLQAGAPSSSRSTNLCQCKLEVDVPA